ncbi:2-hydroxycarboxylate transporter family protein [Candidatus Phytoplasma citri]|uniref:2-hydroxycarboxylate transporter family protein n=1 Tax=Candidatus Phytoplasma citri TaxID=180978 RepID=A0ABU8ZQL0_9MOLU|nr:2-hydroxycarboxylate transporter family protein [Candidatus Phytoplasma aurantifolia]MDO8059965.1 2-hydroxycarboxylate transporter family protein [Candidatus Phytoplasma aurantifolia]MDO8078986.1 2-hydroxycarboxylate transporter family protein [Candidatus Phytoplasma aurantifolia]
MSNNQKKESNTKIFGFKPIFFSTLLLILGLNIFCIAHYPDKINKFYHPLLTPLFLITMLGITLSYIGSKVPGLNKLGLGFLLCIFIPSYLVFKGWIPKQLAEYIDKGFFNKPNNDYGIGINFSQFFITIVIAGSLLSVDRQLLKRSLIKFVPLTIFSIFICCITVGGLGYLLNYQCPEIFQKLSKGPILDSIFFVFVPLTNGGTNLGINGFANGIYKEAFQAEASTIRTAILGPLVLARTLSIFIAGLLYIIFDKSKYSGQGQLEKSPSNSNPKDQIKTAKIQEIKDFKTICMGWLIIFALYSVGSMINQLLFGKMDPMVYMIILLLIIKIFDLMSQENQNAVTQSGKFMTENFTSAVLVGLGLTTNFQQLKETVLNPSILIIVYASLLIAALITFFMAPKLGFYPLETALTSGISSYSIGGAGNVGVMTISHRMNLLPFAMIATRLTGPLVYVIANLAFRSIYMT